MKASMDFSSNTTPNLKIIGGDWEAGGGWGEPVGEVEGGDAIFGPWHDILGGDGKCLPEKFRLGMITSRYNGILAGAPPNFLRGRAALPNIA